MSEQSHSDVTPGASDGWGIVAGYEDGFGRWTEVPDATRGALLDAMGVDPHADAPPAASHVAGTERACAPPPARRVWGLSVQLYAARSRDSWGIGDLADLRSLGGWATAQGAGVLLVNPLDAVAPVTPRETSPYKPTTRRFLDPIYLRIAHVPGAAEVDLSDLDARGRALNDDQRIDRDAVWECKQLALRRIWTEVPEVRSDPELQRFQARRGAALERFAAYCVAVEHHGPDIAGWPEDLRDPEGSGITALARTDDAAFHVWQQYALDRQLARAGQAIGLLRDLPVGFDPDGFDAWTWRDLLADGVTVGAPPDQLGPQGQDWQLPAFVPHKLAAAGYEPLIETLRAEMRHAAGLRIDHVLGLFRLFWIPPGEVPTNGAYVRQPTAELLEVVSRISRDENAWIVGEDLGTVEQGVRPALAARDILRYQVLWFDEDPPASWAELALGSVATHDTATVAGLWTGRDLQLQRSAGLEPDDAWAWSVRDRLAGMAGVPGDADADQAAVALHELIAAGASRVVVAQVDDLLGVVERPNVPGTNRQQRPDNWSLALPVPLDDVPSHPLARAVTQAMDRAR